MEFPWALPDIPLLDAAETRAYCIDKLNKISKLVEDDVFPTAVRLRLANEMLQLIPLTLGTDRAHDHLTTLGRTARRNATFAVRAANITNNENHSDQQCMEEFLSLFERTESSGMLTPTIRTIRSWIRDLPAGCHEVSRNELQLLCKLITDESDTITQFVAETIEEVADMAPYETDLVAALNNSVFATILRALQLALVPAVGVLVRYITDQPVDLAGQNLPANIENFRNPEGAQAGSDPSAPTAALQTLGQHFTVVGVTGYQNNCVFQVLSLLLSNFQTEQLDYELRLRTIRELITHWDVYLQQFFNNNGNQRAEAAANLVWSVRRFNTFSCRLMHALPRTVHRNVSLFVPQTLQQPVVLGETLENVEHLYMAAIARNLPIEGSVLAASSTSYHALALRRLNPAHVPAPDGAFNELFKSLDTISGLEDEQRQLQPQLAAGTEPDSGEEYWNAYKLALQCTREFSQSGGSRQQLLIGTSTSFMSIYGNDTHLMRKTHDRLLKLMDSDSELACEFNATADHLLSEIKRLEELQPPAVNESKFEAATTKVQSAKVHLRKYYQTLEKVFESEAANVRNEDDLKNFTDWLVLNVEKIHTEFLEELIRTKTLALNVANKDQLSMENDQKLEAALKWNASTLFSMTEPETWHQSSLHPEERSAQIAQETNEVLRQSSDVKRMSVSRSYGSFLDAESIVSFEVSEMKNIESMESMESAEMQQMLRLIAEMQDVVAPVERKFADLKLKLSSDFTGEIVRLVRSKQHNHKRPVEDKLSNEKSVGKLKRRLERVCAHLVKLLSKFELPVFDRNVRLARIRYSNANCKMLSTIIENDSIPLAGSSIDTLRNTESGDKLLFSNSKEGKICALSMSTTEERIVEEIYEIGGIIQTFIVMSGVGLVVLSESPYEREAAEKVVEKDPKLKVHIQITQLLRLVSSSSAKLLDVKPINCSLTSKTFILRQKDTTHFLLAVRETSTIRTFQCLSNKIVEKAAITIRGQFHDIDYNPLINHGLISYDSTPSNCEIVNSKLRCMRVIQKNRMCTRFGKVAISRHRLCFVEDVPFQTIAIFDLKGVELKTVLPQLSARWVDLEWLQNGRFYVACWTLLENAMETRLVFRTSSDIGKPIQRNLGNLMCLTMSVTRNFVKKLNKLSLETAKSTKPMSFDSATPSDCLCSTIVKNDEFHVKEDQFKPTYVNSMAGAANEIYFSDALNNCVKKATWTLANTLKLQEEYAQVSAVENTHPKHLVLSGLCHLDRNWLISIADCAHLFCYNLYASKIVFSLSFSDETVYRNCRAFPGVLGKRLFVPVFACGTIHELLYYSESRIMFRVVGRHKLKGFALYFAYFDSVSQKFVANLLSKSGTFNSCVFSSNAKLEQQLPQPSQATEWKPISCALWNHWCFVNNSDWHVYIYNLKNLSIRRTSNQVCMLALFRSSKSVDENPGTADNVKFIFYGCVPNKESLNESSLGMLNATIRLNR